MSLASYPGRVPVDATGVALRHPRAVHCSHEESAYDPTTSSGLVWCGAARVRIARLSGSGAGAGRGDSGASRQRPGGGTAGRDRPGLGAEHRRFHEQRRPVHDPGTGRSPQRAGGDAAGTYHRAQARGASSHSARRRADGGLHARHGREPARSGRGDGDAGSDRAREGAVQRDACRRLTAAGGGRGPAAGAPGQDRGEHCLQQWAARRAAVGPATRADVDQRARAGPGSALHRRRSDPQPRAPGANIAGDVLRRRFQVSPWPATGYNAVNQVVTPHPYTQNSLDMTGRFGSTRFYASASNLTERGAFRFLQGFVRNSFRANVDQAIGSAWNIGVRTAYSRSTQDGLNQEGGGQAFFRLTRVPAIANVLQRDTLGRLYIRPNLQGGGTQNENPLYSLENTARQDLTNRVIGGLTLRYAPVDWFNLEGEVGYDLRRANFSQVNDKGFRTTAYDPVTNGGSIFRGSSSNEAINGGVNANFRLDLARDLRARWSLRYSYEQRDSSIASGFGNALSVKGVTSLVNAASGKTLASGVTSVRQIGLFAGTGLEYKDRYILDALIRRDGSSLFGPGSRWATFGRVSGAWRVALEPWWPLPQVSELKLHGSYGTAGGSPSFSAQYETFTIGAGGLLSLTTLGNRNLQPEVHHEIELGADLELFNRYGLTATYARTRIDRQILLAPVSSSTGYTNQWQNAGTLLNITYELSLNVPLVQRPSVSWSMSFVYDRNRSWIQQLGVPPYFYGAANVQATDQIFQAKEGELYGTFYGRKFLTSCGELPAPFNTDCGGAKSPFQMNEEGRRVWGGSDDNPRWGSTHNLWETSVPGCINSAGIAETVCSQPGTSTITAPWGVGLNWGMPGWLHTVSAIPAELMQP